MAGSLKSLAGAAFSTADVIAARHAVIPPEQLVLDRYVFLPHIRSGIAAARLSRGVDRTARPSISRCLSSTIGASCLRR